MSAILAIAAKDLRVLFRVKAGLFFAFAWPLIIASYSARCSPVRATVDLKAESGPRG